MPRRVIVRGERSDDALAFEGDGTGVGLDIAGAEIKKRCLARSVGADDGQEFVRMDVEIDSVGGLDPAEADVKSRDRRIGFMGLLSVFPAAGVTP